MRQQEDKNVTVTLVAYWYGKWMQTFLLLHLQVFVPHK